MTDSVYVRQGQFPQWPCLFLHSESIFAAVVNWQLRHGRDGRMVNEGEPVTPERRTIAHADLKAWIRAEFPADVQKAHMAWLFDDVERSVHPAVSTEAYAMLKAEADGLRGKLTAENSRAEAAEKEAERLRLDSSNALDPRERSTLLRIIRALDSMAKLPERGAASSVLLQLQTLGFTKGPGDSVIREKIDQARALEPDGNPQ